jgi:3-oxoacyl-ACP reductase-like protein
MLSCVEMAFACLKNARFSDCVVTEPGIFVFSTSRCARGNSSLLLLLLDELALDKDLDLVAYDKPAVEHHVKRHAENRKIAYTRFNGHP